MHPEFIDHYLVEIDSLYERSVTKSGIITLNDAYINPESQERFIYKRLHGTVLSVPMHVTDTPVDAVDPGLPPPHKYVSADFLMDKANRGYKVSRQEYYPSTFEAYDVITYQDIFKLMDVKVGDKIYFDEKVTEDENYIGRTKKDKKLHYRCLLTEVFCAVREVKRKVDGRYKPKIFMQGGWVLAEPDMELWSEITSPSGIIMKVQPEAKSYRAWVEHIRERDDVKQGDLIVYEHHADVIVSIEKKEYFLFREENILAKVKTKNKI